VKHVGRASEYLVATEKGSLLITDAGASLHHW